MSSKVTIVKSFVVPPAAPFTPGEVLTVNDELAAEWIRTGNAIAGTIKPYVNPASNLVRKEKRPAFFKRKVTR